eukprot:Pompholyxophrys_punicea_v1_NODE_378_length_2095_cov_23.619608.p2 type:complete len:118 gc:universal NODE_378_length_2095_cov_23.619608:2093-1740(-)
MKNLQVYKLLQERRWDWKQLLSDLPDSFKGHENRLRLFYVNKKPLYLKCKNSDSFEKKYKDWLEQDFIADSVDSSEQTDEDSDFDDVEVSDTHVPKSSGRPLKTWEQLDIRTKVQAN